MIAFACKQCGKRYDRPEDACGTLIFCGCGAGTRVPYESTMPPTAEPFDPPARTDRPAARLDAGSPPRWDSPQPEPLRRWQEPTRDRNYCLNHPSTRTAQTCTDCGEGFCASCAVVFQGSPRCGPCKNYRVRAAQRSPTLSVMAILAPLLALGAGLLWLFVLLFMAGVKAEPPALAVTAIIGLLPQVLAFAMAAMAETRIETNLQVGGRSWAMTGMVSAVICAVLILLLMGMVMQATG